MAQPQNPRRQGPPLTWLPLEIVQQIGRSLELHDMFLLAQTCQDLRNIFFHQNKAVFGKCPSWPGLVKSLSLAEQTEFDQGIAYTKSDRWFCRVCLVVHRLTSKTVPEGHSCVGYLGRFDVPMECLYQIRDLDVCIALKFARMPTEFSGKTRENVKQVLRPAEGQVTGYPRPHPSIATPLIKNGHFMVKATYSWYTNVRPNLLDASHEQICNHLPYFGKYLRYATATSPYQRATDWANEREVELDLSFQQGMDTVYESRWALGEFVGSCEQCRLDYSIRKEGTSMFLSVWYDLGTETVRVSPMSDLGRWREIKDVAQKRQVHRHWKVGDARKLYEKSEDDV